MYIYIYIYILYMCVCGGVCVCAVTNALPFKECIFLNVSNFFLFF